MSQPLRADTVTEVTIGPAVAVGDGFTPVTTLTVASADEAEIVKHNATTNTAITGTLAAITNADGYYALDLVTGDVDTEGRLTILINDDSLILPIRQDFIVYSQEVFDDLFIAGSAGYLKPVTAGRDLDVTATGAAGIDWGNVENQTTAVDLSATDIQLCDTVTTLTSHTAQTGDSFAIVNSGTFGNAQLVRSTTPGNALDITATGAAGIDWGNLENPTTAVDLSATDIQLVDTATTVTNDVGISATAVDNVWNELLTGHTTLGSFGQVLNGLGARTGAVNDAGALVGDFDVDGFTEATDDHFNGMVMTFTTGALTGQSRTISDYTGSGQNCVFAEAWTNAPTNNDEFIITPAQLAGSTLFQVLRLFITILNQSTGQLDAGSLTAGTIDAGAIATDAIGSDELATTAINEIRDSIINDATTFSGADIDAAVTSRLAPTTAGRTLDVTVGGTAGVDWANVEAQTTAVDLSATTIRGADLLNSNVTLRAGTHSDATITGLVRLDSDVTIADFTYSAVTVRVEPIAYSGMTVGIDDIATGTIQAVDFAASAIDAAALATDAVEEIADAVLDRDMGTGTDSGSSTVRTPRDALRALRNRVVLSGNTLTVYDEDDTTTAWTASLVTTGDSNFPTAFDPNS